MRRRRLLHMRRSRRPLPAGDEHSLHRLSDWNGRSGQFPLSALWATPLPLDTVAPKG